MISYEAPVLELIILQDDIITTSSDVTTGEIEFPWVEDSHEKEI